jgi:hypothetical protein
MLAAISRAASLVRRFADRHWGYCVFGAGGGGLTLRQESLTAADPLDCSEAQGDHCI